MGQPMGQQILNKFTSSIVSVELRPRRPTEVNELWNYVSPLHGEESASEKEERVWQSRCPLRGTGFVVKDESQNLFILTCFHLLENLSSARKPISSATVNELYRTFILCDHLEQKVQREQESKRQYIEGEVWEISCGTDLMLIRIRKRGMVCKENHQAIPIADLPLAPLHEVLMLSWPYQMERTITAGRISNPCRHYSALLEENQENTHGYTMRLCEMDITSGSGCSGAPVLSASSAECVGVLHAGNGTFSYCISIDTLKSTLTKWKVLDSMTGVGTRKD